MWRIPSSILAASSLVACTLIVDRGRYEDGSGGAAGPTTTTFATSASMTGAESSSGQGGAGGGACVTPAFHVDFDGDTSEWSSILKTHGGPPGVRVESPRRHGSGAWKIAVESELESNLKTNVIKTEHEYWYGFSQAYDGVPSANETKVMRLSCETDSTGKGLLELGIDKGSPVLPFVVNAPAGNHLTDDLGTIAMGSGFFDWIIHFELSTGSDGSFFEIYLDGQLRFHVDGVELDPACTDSGAIDVGVYRVSGPTAWSLVEDEITLLPGPVSAEDALFTLHPDNDCF